MPGSILVADDEPDIRRVLSQSLSMEGYQVATVADGQAAIDRFQVHPVDVVVTDMRMPGVDGLGVLKAVKTMDRDAEVIVLTGYASLQNAVAALKNEGAFHYLTKPLEDIEELLAAVRHALERRRLRLQNRLLLNELNEKNQALEHSSASLRAAQSDLKQARDHYLDLYDNAPVGYLTLDGQGCITSINLAGASLLGFDAERMVSRRLNDFVSPESRTAVEGLFNDVQQSGLAKTHEFKLHGQDGDYRWFQLQCRSLSSGNGRDSSVRCAFFDIDDRKRARRRLNESETRWKTFMQSSPGYVFMLDRSGIVVALNRPLPGCREDDMLRHAFVECFRSGNAEPVNQCLDRVRTRQSIERLEMAHLTPEGRLMYFDVHVAPLLAEDRVFGMVANLADVTARKAMEIELAASRQRFMTLVNTIPSGVQEITTDGMITYANPANHDMFGMPPGSLIGQSIYDRLTNDTERRELRDFIAHLVAHQPSPTPWNGKNRTVEGRTIDVQTDWDYRRGPDGEVIGFISVITDITQRLRWEEDVKAERNRLETITQSLQAGLVVITPDHRVEWANRVMLENRPDIVGESCHAAFFEENTPCGDCTMQTFLGSGLHETRTEYQCRDKQGRPRWYELISSPIPGEHGRAPAMLVLQMDITNQKQAAEKRVQLEKHLADNQKNEAIRVLAGGIAHRFNNALAVVIGNLELMGLEDAANPTLVESASMIHQAADEMANQTKRLLAYARGGKYTSRYLELGAFIRDSLPTLRYSFDIRHDIALTVHHEPIGIHADPTQVEMVLSALVQNAVEATAMDGRIRIDISRQDIEAPQEKKIPPGRYARLRIEDNGQGMDEQTRQRMFEPYFSTKFQGRGLGLAAVQGIISNHKGYIRVTSTVGQGSVVEIYLPLVEKRTEPSTPVAAAKPLAGLRLLVIEDDPMLLPACEAMLTDLGCHVWCTETAHAALSVVNERGSDIDVVLMDLILPDMSAMDLFNTLCAVRPGIRVVLCSGYSVDGPAQDILDAGALDFLQKPYSLQQLKESITRVAGTPTHPR